MLHLTRRAALLGLASAFTLGRASLALADAPTDQRFVVVILRGALDGLSAVVPYGDRGTDRTCAARSCRRRRVRTAACSTSAASTACIRRCANLHAMYRAGEVLAVHAVAGPYRVRSHFEAQDCLESGADHRMTSGWLNRAIGALPRPATVDAEATGDRRLGAAAAARPGRRWRTGRRTASAPLDADLYARIAALNQADRVTRPGDRRGPERTRLQCGRD